MTSPSPPACTPPSAVLHHVTFSTIPLNHTQPEEHHVEKQSRLLVLLDRIERSKLYKTLHKYFKSNLYFGLGITLTLLQLIMSALAKILNERRVDAGANTLIIIFMIVDIYQFLESTMRMIIMRSSGAMLDGLILYIDFGLNLYSVIAYAQSGFTSLSKAFGVANTARLLAFIADTGVLKNIFRNLSRGLGTILLIFVYAATWVYTFAILSYFIYNPYFFQNAERCPQCAESFGSLENSFLTQFQILTFDNWMSNVVLELTNQAAVFSTFTWIYFILYTCFSSYLMVNIITSIILQILLDLDNSAPDSGSTLKNVLHQLFGWTVAIGEDIKKAVHKEHGVGKIFVNMYSKVMEKRDKTLHKEADKLTQILEKLEALDESVDTALGNIHEIERQKQRLRNPANSSTVSINTENHLREVRKNIVEIEKEISDAFKDIGDDEPKSVLLGAEMEQERKSMEIEKRKSMDEKRNEEKRKSTTVTSPVKDNQ